MSDLERNEHSAWLQLCKQLEMVGAVTRSDLESPQSAMENTGHFLLASIRAWGKALVELRRGE